MGHTATLLPDGLVLVAGGDDCNGDPCLTSAAELYNPGTRVLDRDRVPISTGRKQHTATLLLDGRVLVAGGTDGYTSGGWHRLDTAELYGPISGN